jgi:MoxR-like ATPase
METYAQQLKLHVQEELNKVIFGLEHCYDIIATAIIAGGNIVITGLPGSGKTLLCKSLMHLIEQDAARIDCGNDIEFNNIVHSLCGVTKNQSVAADKSLFYLAGLNRLTPNTQAILLPMMEEHQLVNNGQVVQLDKDFRIIATYDPFCYEDTFPLIAALMDRFYISITLGYLTGEQEISILKAYDYPLAGHEEDLTPILNPLSHELILQARQEAKTVTLKESMYKYVIELIHAIRQHPDIQNGVSQRGSLSVINAAKINARLHDRDYVNPDDIRAVLPFSLTHRLRLHANAEINDIQPCDIIEEALSKIGLPGDAANQN